MASPSNRQLQVTVPEGTNGGQEITVAVPPNGQQCRVRIPEGLNPGDQFLVQMPEINEVPTVVGRPVQAGPAMAAGAPMYLGGPVPSIIITAVDQRQLTIARYVGTVKCISCLDVVLCLSMSMFWNPWFAVIAPLPLCGYWGARTLNPYWLLGYQLFIILEITMRLFGSMMPELLDRQEVFGPAGGCDGGGGACDESMQRVSIWTLLLIGVNIYILFIVNKLQRAICGLTFEQREELRQPRDFQGFALY